MLLSPVRAIIGLGSELDCATTAYSSNETGILGQDISINIEAMEILWVSASFFAEADGIERI